MGCKKMRKVLYFVFTTILSIVLIGSVSAKPVMTTIQETVPEEIETFEGQAGYEEYLNLLNNANFSNYTNSDDKVNIYIFRGNTCWHCLDEISYLASKIDEIGQYANIYTYEVYQNTDNSKLMTAVSKKVGNSSTGVPFTVIGKKYWSGFGESMYSEMLSAVKELAASEEKYDIKDYIDLETGKVIKEDKDNKTLPTVLLLSAVLIGGIVVIYFISKSK